MLKLLIGIKIKFTFETLKLLIKINKIHTETLKIPIEINQMQTGKP